jgi:hypothetical protein
VAVLVISTKDGILKIGPWPINRTREKPNHGTLAYFIIRYRYTKTKRVVKISLSVQVEKKSSPRQLSYYLPFVMISNQGVTHPLLP